MFNVEEMRLHFRSLDWPGCLDLLGTVEPETKTDAAARLVQELIHSGCLILRRKDKRLEKKRPEFITGVTKYLADNGDQATIDEFAAHLEHSRMIETAYREILRTLSESKASQSAPDETVWATIAMVGNEVMKVHDAILPSLKKVTKPFIFLSSSMNIEDDQSHRTPADPYINGLIDVLGITLKMLAHQQRWFDSSSRHIVFPTHPKLTQETVVDTQKTIELGTLWRILEYCEERFRYFGGRLSEIFIYPEKYVPSEKVVCFNFEYDHGWDVLENIANSRLDHRFFQHYNQLIWEDTPEQLGLKITKSDPAPAGFLSTDEINWCIALGELLHFNVILDPKEYGGLQLKEWLRGYAALQEISRGNSDQPETDCGLYISMRWDDLPGMVSGFGLPKEKATIFCDRVTYSENSADLFDAPILRLQDGNAYLFRPSLLHANLAKLVLSTISNLGVAIEKKGQALEDYVLKFLTEKGLRCSKIEFVRDGEQYECDVALLMDEFLFLFECKNYALSDLVVTRSYYFKKKMIEAVRQIKRIANAIENNPEVVSQHIGPATWTRIVPCVLYGMPWSSGLTIDGVYVYDASALKKFFDQGAVGINTAMSVDKHKKVIWRHKVLRLWAGNSPSGEDLLNQIQDPIQLNLHLPRYFSQPFREALSSSHALQSVLLRPRDESLEAAIHNMGLPVDAIMGEMEEIHSAIDELSGKMEQ